MTSRKHNTGVVQIPLPTPFPVGPVNVFLVKSDPLTLVDTGADTDASHEALVAGLAREGLRLGDIQAIVITHAHIDHIGMLSRVLENCQAETYAHPIAVARSRHFDRNEQENRRFAADLMREFGAPEQAIDECMTQSDGYSKYRCGTGIDHAVADRDRLGALTAYHAPGHSATDLVLVDHDRRFALTGDHLLRTISPNPLPHRPEPGQQRTKSLVEFRRSLRRTRELDIDVCYPGHGGHFGDHRAVVDRLLERQDRRGEKILRLLAGEDYTPYQICMALFPELETEYLYLGLSSVVGHIEVLEEEGRVTLEHRDGVVHCTESMGAEI